MYKARRLGPEGDLYLHGVKKVRLMIEDGYPTNQRVLAVHTGDVKWCRDLLVLPDMYQLPSHLPDLLQRIHQLNPGQAKSVQSVSS